MFDRHKKCDKTPSGKWRGNGGGVKSENSMVFRGTGRRPAPAWWTKHRGMHPVRGAIIVGNVMVAQASFWRIFCSTDTKNVTKRILASGAAMGDV